MKLRLSVLALVALAAMLSLPTAASASWFHHSHKGCCGCQSRCNSCNSCNTCGSKCGSYHAEGKCGVGTRDMAYNGAGDNDYAVAGYNDTMHNGYSRSMADVDAARFAEYHRIYGDGPSAVAGYSATWRPWMEGGTYVTVNGQRTWATPGDFTWMDNRWAWSDDNTATVMFDDPRFNLSSRDWTMGWSPWANGGSYVNVNGQRVWATPNDFTWSNNQWTWNDDPTATVSFDDDRVSLTSNDWINHDRFDLPVDRDKLDLDTDKFKVPDKLEIK